MTGDDSARRLTMDTRAVQSPVGYILTVAIMTILLTVLVTGVSNFTTAQAEDATEQHLHVVADHVAAELMMADATVQSMPSAEYTNRFQIPGGQMRYVITIKDDINADGVDRVVVHPPGDDTSQELRFRARTDLNETTVTGTKFKIVYTGSKLSLEEVE